MNAQKCSKLALHLTCTFLAALFGLSSMLNAQTTPSLVDPNLRVQTIVGNLNQPTSTAFLGPNEFFVLEKATGQVKRVLNGVVQSTVLDLAVKLRLRARSAGHRSAPELRGHTPGLPVLDAEHDRR